MANSDPSTPHPRTAEFLTTLDITVPADTLEETVDDTKGREARRAHELVELGHLLRLWGLAGGWRTLGLWQAQDPADMQAILESLPLYPWMTVETTPLTQHPNDPAIVWR